MKPFTRDSSRFTYRMLSAKTPIASGLGVCVVSIIPLPAARFVLGEQHVLLRVELIDALHGPDIDAGPILHVDASFSDDRETGRGSTPHHRC